MIIISKKELFYYCIYFLSTVVLIYVLKELQQFLRPFIIGIILTFLIVHIKENFFLSIKKRLHFKKLLSTFFFVFIIGILFSIPIFFDEQISPENKSLEDTLKSISKLEIDFFGKVINLSSLIENFSFKDIVSNLSKSTINFITNFFSEFFIVLIFLFFMVPSYISLKKDCFNKKNKLNLLNTLKKIEDGISEYLKIKIFVSFLVSLSTFILLLFFGVDNYIFLSLITFFLNFIPNIGSIFSVVLIFGLVVLKSGFLPTGLFILISLSLIHIIIGYYIEPKMSSKKLEISALVILMSLLFWNYVWGIVGVFFAVPLTVSIKIIMQYLIKFKHKKD